MTAEGERVSAPEEDLSKVKIFTHFAIKNGHFEIGLDYLEAVQRVCEAASERDRMKLALEVANAALISSNDLLFRYVSKVYKTPTDCVAYRQGCEALAEISKIMGEK